MFVKRLRARLLLLVVVLIAAVALGARPADAQTHEPAQPPAAGGQAQAEGAAAEHGEEGAHDEGILPTIARLFNFAILAGLLVYFLKSPVAAYLGARHKQIRQDLVTAAELRHAASAQLAEIDQRLKSLPAELEALSAQGAGDVQAERARIAQAAAAERDRLIDQTRREIAMRLRVAKRELVELAANLAVGVARERITKTITPDDQLRLVDRYTSQLKEAR